MDSALLLPSLGLIVLLAIGHYYSTRPALISIAVTVPAEASREWTSQSFTTTNSVRHADPSMIECYDPATGYSLGVVVIEQDVAAVVSRAREAQAVFAKTSFATRRAILRTLLDYVVNHQNEICAVASRDSGKTAVDGGFGEILTTCERLRWTIANGERVLKPSRRTPGLIMASKNPVVIQVPVGVVGVIISWNYPFHNVFGPLISGIFAGNAVVVKVSEHCAWSTIFWQSIISTALAAHGVSPDLVAFVNGFAEAGSELVKHADKVLDEFSTQITFIGSPQVGKTVMKCAAESLTPVILELGGKDCAVVFADCDYDQFKNSASRLAFQNAGQNCAGLERIIIESSIHDRFVEDMKEVVGKFRIGPALGEDVVDMGAITMAAQIDKIQELVDDAVSKGAKLELGGKRFVHPNYPKGQFYLPTIITNVSSAMKIFSEEVFGPVMVVLRFETAAEAVKLANGSPFGLGSGVYSLDIKKAGAVCAALRVGMTNINAFGTTYLCQGLPFGGVGISGVGCFSGEEGLLGQCYPKATTSDVISAIRTAVPAPLLYPLTAKSAVFQQDVVTLLYGGGKAGALVRLAKSVLGL